MQGRGRWRRRKDRGILVVDRLHDGGYLELRNYELRELRRQCIEVSTAFATGSPKQTINCRNSVRSCLPLFLSTSPLRRRRALCLRPAQNVRIERQRNSERHGEERGDSLPHQQRIAFVKRPAPRGRGRRADRAVLQREDELEHVAETVLTIGRGGAGECLVEPRRQVGAVCGERLCPLEARMRERLDLAVGIGSG